MILDLNKAIMCTKKRKRVGSSVTATLLSLLCLVYLYFHSWSGTWSRVSKAWENDSRSKMKSIDSLPNNLLVHDLINNLINQSLKLYQPANMDTKRWIAQHMFTDTSINPTTCILPTMSSFYFVTLPVLSNRIYQNSCFILFFLVPHCVTQTSQASPTLTSWKHSNQGEVSMASKMTKFFCVTIDLSIKEGCVCYFFSLHFSHCQVLVREGDIFKVNP